MVVGDTKEEFLEQLKKYADRVQSYEDEEAQKSACTVMPLDRLRESAKRRLEGIVSADEMNDKDPNHVQFRCPEAALAKELLRWFKIELFQWVDTLDCPKCAKKMKGRAKGEPTAEDLKDSATRVEVHSCDECETSARFPRYNNPVKLLSTRRGRCGEWANAFTLCCRSAGLEARLVLDWTDHVWTEVWSETEGRWLHADSCENVLDEPLLYEQGWGKKLNYIIAFGRFGVVDVTRRYTADYDNLPTRRSIISEEELSNAMASCNDEKLSALDDEGRKQEDIRQEMEKLHLQPKKSTAENLPGRQSGAEEWIKERGEDGRGK